MKVGAGDTVEYRGYQEAEPQTFTTRTPAEVLSGHTAVLWLNGMSGCVCVDACRKVVAPNAKVSGAGTASAGLPG